MSWENPSSGPGMGGETQPSQCSDKKPGRCSMDQKLRVREMETSAEGRVCHRPAMPDANHHWWGNEHIHVHTGALSLGWGRCYGTPLPNHHGVPGITGLSTLASICLLWDRSEAELYSEVSVFPGGSPTD